MHKYLLPILITLFVAQSAGAASAVFRGLGLDAAREQAKQENKMLLIDFTASWCGPCHRMEADTWSNPTVQKWIAENAVAIQLDVDKDTQTSAEFRVNAMPSVVVFTPKDYQKEFDRHIGYMDTPDTMHWFDALKRGETTLDMLRNDVAKFAGKGGRDEVRSHYLYAHALLDKEDQQAKALEQYMWLWQNMATVLPSSEGERVTVVMNEIARLVSQYPQARVKFSELRDQDEKNKKDLDFLVLNEALREQKKTLDWFDSVKKNPAYRANFKDALGVMLERIMIANDRWSDLIYLFPDPMDELKDREKFAEIIMADLKKRGAQNVQDPFPRDAAILYVALLAGHKDADAKKLATAAFQYRSDAASNEIMRKQFVVLALQAKEARRDQRKWVLKDEKLLAKLDEALQQQKSQNNKPTGTNHKDKQSKGKKR